MEYNNIPASYTWRASYQLPLESFRSCLEKFGFLNCESYSFSKKFMKTNYRKESCSSIIDLITQHRFLHKRFRYCPKCLSEMGYHSILHQSYFFDECFLHSNTKLIPVSNPLDNAKTCIEIHDLYTVSNIVLGSKEKLFSLLQNADKKSQNMSISLLNFDIGENREVQLFESLKDFIKFFFFKHSQNKHLVNKQRKICSVRKSSLTKLSKKAIEELLHNSIELDDQTHKSVREHRLNTLQHMDRDLISNYCPLYARSLILNFVLNYFENIRAYSTAYNRLMLGYIDVSKASDDDVKIWAKMLMVKTLTGSDEPTFFRTMWANNQSIKSANYILSFEQLAAWRNGNYEYLMFALLDDIFEYGSLKIEEMIARGEIDSKDNIKEKIFRNAISQYLVMETPNEVTVYAFDKE